MEATLKKQYKNHPAGTVLMSVSIDVFKELRKGGYIESYESTPAEKRALAPSRTRKAQKPAKDKMVKEASEEKKKEGGE